MREKGGKAPGAGKARDTKKKEKGGARSFVTSAEDLEHRNKLEQEKQSARKVRRADGEDGSGSDEDDDSDDDESDEGGDEPLVAFERLPQQSLFGFSQSATGPAMETKPKKKSGVAGVIKVQNPNMKAPQNKVMKAKDMNMSGDVEQQLSRREREAIEKERAAARYLKKHLAGETDEAKKDLARLQEVKRRREEAEQRKKEEEAAAAEREKSKKKVVAKDDDEPLDARAIKALKPNVLKDKLKERNLSTQGQKKDLIQRLIDYENERAL